MIFFIVPVSEKVYRVKNPNDEYEALIADIALGDRQALKKLYEKTKTGVFGFALSITKDFHRAEDVTQDTYVRIFLSAKSYNPRGKPMAWILTIAKNTSLMELRKKRTVSLNDDLLQGNAKDFSDKSINRVMLRAALDILTDQEREIVMLHSVTGLKHREIAEIMQIPLSTALSKYRRALSKLRKRLKEEDL